VLIAPQPGGQLTWATARLKIARGLVEVHWRDTGPELIVEAAIPAGVSCVMRLPGEPDLELAAGRHTITTPVHSREKTGELA
jgi:alpha-L-rhamnosidase